MKKLHLLIFLLIPGFILAQTNAEKLEKGVKIYNDTRDFEDGLKPGKTTMADIDKMKQNMADAFVFLDDVKANGSAEEAKVARYFIANFQYEIGFVYGMMGKNKESYDALTKIKSDYEFFSNESQFPLNYQFESKNYSIKYSNFAPTLAEYYTGMAEVSANLSKTEESIEWSRKTINFSYTTDWYRYIALNKILESKKKLGEWDKEMLDCGLQQIITYNKLDTSYLRSIKENEYPTANLGVVRIRSTLAKRPELADGEYHRGTAAPILAELKMYSDALEFYEAALKDGFADYNKSYLFGAAEFAIKEENNSTALLALNLLYTKNESSLSCSEWGKLSDLYGNVGDTEKKKDCLNKSVDCIRKERKKEKIHSRGGSGFGFYAGIYPLPMACRFNRYRDYGGVAGIILGKMTIEGSYKLINRNHVITEDMSFKSIDVETPYYWEGYKAHIALKFGMAGSKGFYIGPCLEMVNREFEPIWTNITNVSTGVLVASDKKFFVTEKSYNLYFNYGAMIAEKYFFFDYFFGIGCAYSKFDIGSAEFARDQYEYSDVLLQNRKETRFAPALRMGITIGFSLTKN